MIESIDCGANVELMDASGFGGGGVGDFRGDSGRGDGDGGRSATIFAGDAGRTTYGSDFENKTEKYKKEKLKFNLRKI